MSRDSHPDCRAALADVVRSVRAIYPDMPYRIGPSTIAMRQNPYGAATKDNPACVRIPMVNVDPRHNGDFAAAWTLAYAATVSGARLEALTLSTLTGPFGLIAGRGEPAAEGELRPLARVLAELGKMAGKRLWRVRSSHSGALAGLGVPGITLLANLTPETIEVHPGWGFSTARSLARSRRVAVAGRGIELSPYESIAVE